MAAGRRSDLLVHQNPAALVAGDQFACRQVADAVELHGGQAQMTSVTVVPDETGHGHPSRPGPELVVAGQQVGGDGPGRL